MRVLRERMNVKWLKKKMIKWEEKKRVVEAILGSLECKQVACGGGKGLPILTERSDVIYA